MSFHSPARLLVPTLILLLVTAVVALASPTLALAQSAGDNGGGSGCVVGPLCGLGNPADWLQQTTTNILTDLLSGLANTFGDAIVGFLNDVDFLTGTPENLSYNDALVKQFAVAMQVLADGLLAVAPLAALLWILPQSQAWGRRWGALFVGTVFAQAVQVLTLRLGLNLATGSPPVTAAGCSSPCSASPCWRWRSRSQARWAAASRA